MVRLPASGNRRLRQRGDRGPQPKGEVKKRDRADALRFILESRGPWRGSVATIYVLARSTHYYSLKLRFETRADSSWWCAGAELRVVTGSDAVGRHCSARTKMGDLLRLQSSRTPRLEHDYSGGSKTMRKLFRCYFDMWKEKFGRSNKKNAGKRSMCRMQDNNGVFRCRVREGRSISLFLKKMWG
jgi:hypothetical protein